MAVQQKLQMLGAYPSDIAKSVLVVGEPKRAEYAANLLDKSREVGNYREYVTFTGEYKGKQISITSHGVGSAGANIAFHELFQAGVTTVIRGGTAGGHKSGLIVATGAIRNDGTSVDLVPLAYPAVAHYQVVQALIDSSTKNGYPNPTTGIVLSRSHLYPGLIEHPWNIWVDARVVGVEMELALLLVMAGVQGIRAGGIFASDATFANPSVAKKTDQTGYDPFTNDLKQYTQLMIQVALDALVALG